MSRIAEQLMSDIKTAMKAGDKEALVALRSLHAKIKDATVNAGKEMTDGDVLQVIAKLVKQGKDSAQQFRAGERTELAEKEEREVALFERYQPKQLTEDELRPLVRAAIEKTGASSKKDMGKVMGALMPTTKGKADGALVSRLVSESLAD